MEAEADASLDPDGRELRSLSLLQSKRVVTVSDIIDAIGHPLQSTSSKNTTDVVETVKYLARKIAEFGSTLDRKSWDVKILDLVKDTSNAREDIRSVEGDGGFEALVGLLEEGHFNGICDLRVWIGSEVTQESARRFCNLFQTGRLNDLRCLHLHSLLSEGAETFWRELAESLSSAALKELWIFGDKLGKFSVADELADILANQFASGHLRSLQVLVLENGTVSDEGVMLLANSLQSGHAKKLEVLSLRRNRCGDEGVQSLADAFERGMCPKLRALDLSWNFIENKGFVDLAKAFKSGHLRELENICLDRLFIYGQTEDYDWLMALVGVLEAHSLPRLKIMSLHKFSDGLSLPSSIRKALENSYRRNPYLIASLYSEEPQYDDPWFYRIQKLRLSNEERVQRLRVLQNKDDLAGQHSKIFFCGDPRVGKTTLRITLTADKATMTSTLVNKTCGLLCGNSLPEEQDPTRGIEVTHVQTKSVTLALWDLAGQHDYQVLHSAFMPDMNFADGQATFFAIVCNAKNIDTAKSQLEY